jgi:hypothetical protein
MGLEKPLEDLRKMYEGDPSRKWLVDVLTKTIEKIKEGQRL